MSVSGEIRPGAGEAAEWHDRIAPAGRGRWRSEPTWPKPADCNAM